MTSRTEELRPQPGRRLPRGRRAFLAAALGIALVALAATSVFLGFGAGLLHPQGRALPSFPSLTDDPDSSLHGTVAYFADDTRCVRIIAASGKGAKDVLCLSPSDVAVRPAEGLKPAGPQLVWRPDGRLEVTMFLWKPGPGKDPVYTSHWQRIVDVVTGAVENTTAAPSAPNSSTEPTSSPNGERVAYTFDPASGRVKVSLTDSSGTRTMLSVRGPGEYTYRFGPVFWAPNGQWIAASDVGRILIITPTERPVTRVLVTGSGGGAGGGTAGPSFAVTSADLIGSVP